MWTELRRHPESEGGEGFAVQARAVRTVRSLSLQYRVTDARETLRLAPPAEPDRTDGLWRTTCLEAFVRRPGGGYYEWNLSPSTRWAAYRFSAYREDMADIDQVDTPHIRTRWAAEAFELDAELALDALSDLPADRPWRAGLTAVLEDAHGRISYWALAHGAGKPDFHHPDSFALELPLTDPR